jgi:hypothetical protein
MTPKATASTFRKRAGTCNATTKVQLFKWNNFSISNDLNFY